MLKARSSGNAIADRRFAYAMDYKAGGDPLSAAELVMQALDEAPDWAAGWLALGDLNETLGRRGEAIDTYRKALHLDPDDEAGAGARLARLGEIPADGAMTPAHITALFDEYAPRFERSLVDNLSYRGPALLRMALERSGRDGPFERVLDLGCGTGLVAETFRSICRDIVGVDLSAAMLAKARAKQIYRHLEQAEIGDFLLRQDAGSVDLILAADVFIYFGDLDAVFRQAARVLAPGGRFAFTVQSQDGPAAFILNHDLRYAHSRQGIEGWAVAAGLQLRHLDDAWARTDRGAPVPGLVAVLGR
ncbi:methyltransferase domain-containing protein [Labrys sp. LIt4]|uniref:SAM-dependent methyltransferase n=1 Tax=Labrys okinawensis TaxID=346911 RepID=A0A2S9Q7H6_9HYPH|nr:MULTISPECIES: methyltransferase domain-containing protein [Labrys]MBP0577857.1 methyltransferase domain-containing protein [Labrys sp. LIt4]PRH85313.1 SAM-dependent methyltransferase [Labrys okinawensis]